MTQRHLPRVLLIAALLVPVLAAAASDDEMLHAFDDAARSLPSVPIPPPQPKPKPTVKPVVKPAAHPEDPSEINQLRLRISQLEKEANESHLNSDKQNEVLKAQLIDSEKKRAVLRTEQAESEKQLAMFKEEKQLQAKNLATLTTELEIAKKQPAAEAQLAEPKSEAERDGYMLGQSIASNAVAQLQMVKDTGLSISMDQLIAGVTTQLKTGTSVMSGEEMSQRYAAMQESINKGMSSLIDKGYAQLDKRSEKRKALMTVNGMRWFAVKSVKTKLIPDQQVEVSVKISTLNGKVINDFADDKVLYDNNLPSLLYDGMSLTGKGGAVEGWALAKDIFEREPLPPWVAPYDVIHYQLAIK